MSSTNGNYLQSVIKQFEYYKHLGEATMAQLSDEEMFFQYNETSNSMAIIAKHLWGNMLSRWTDFLNSDGEKPWRKRDDEFKNDWNSKEDVLIKWEEGWSCLLNTLRSLTDEDLDKTIYIRNMGQTVTDAINRQLAHYASHVGQMLLLGKMIKNTDWKALSIPVGQSKEYNKEKFTKEKRIEHFTDEWTKK